MKTNTETLISAMRKLAEDIESQDGVANAAIAEAADRLGELQDEVERLKADIKIIRLRDCERDADVIDRAIADVGYVCTYSMREYANTLRAGINNSATGPRGGEQ